jgi:RNA polymerase sigma factor (sigma-70 family)
MLSERSLPDSEVRRLDPVVLFKVCAENRQNSEAWLEFIRRYTNKIKFFISGSLRQFSAYSSKPISMSSSSFMDDFFQNAILRLVENDCAAMKRFSGSSENELMAYIAVICRSSVMDGLRHGNAIKRKPVTLENESMVANAPGFNRLIDQVGCEREILVKELVRLTMESMKSSRRDQLVFKLHFFEGLSYNQIAGCEGINLSKAGVEKLLKRLVSRVQDLVSSDKPEETIQ